MPMNQLKEISKVMNDIMGVDKKVQELKQHLANTSHGLIKHIQE